MHTTNKRFLLFDLRVFEKSRDNSCQAKQEDEGFVDGHGGNDYVLARIDMLCYVTQR